MELATVKAYLTALDKLKQQPAYAAEAGDLLRELADPVNKIAETLGPIHRHPVTPFEQLLRSVVRVIE